MSLQPARKSFTIWKGTTFAERFIYLDGGIDADPKNLSGYTALLEIKDAPDGTVLFTLSTANSRIQLAGVTGAIVLTINATDTAALTWGSGVYDLTIAGGGVTDALLWGYFRVRGI